MDGVTCNVMIHCHRHQQQQQQHPFAAASACDRAAYWLARAGDLGGLLVVNKVITFPTAHVRGSHAAAHKLASICFSFVRSLAVLSHTVARISSQHRQRNATMCQRRMRAKFPGLVSFRFRILGILDHFLDLGPVVFPAHRGCVCQCASHVRVSGVVGISGALQL